MNDLPTVKLFGALLERRLSPMEDIYRSARAAGFRAWEVFADERLRLIEDSAREAEAKLLLLSCREEFCNFVRYIRDVGGDGFEIAELAKLREQARRASHEGLFYLLQSDSRMRSDLALARRYASATEQMASPIFESERARYMESLKSMIEVNSGRSTQEYVAVVLKERFSGTEFSPRPSRSGSACFEKSLTQSATALVCLEDIDRLGAAGWFGEVQLSFYVRPGGSVSRAYVNTCGKGLPGLPLRLVGLAPGLMTYSSGGYLLPASSFTVAGHDVVVLTSWEEGSAPEHQARALSQLALVLDCFLTFFAAVEPALALACADLHVEERRRE
jgi:hypothetical protein